MNINSAITQLSVLMGILLPAAAAFGQVPEIPDSSLSDIAVTRTVNGQDFIVYNPVVCEQLGSALCSFYRIHEYGHVVLGHLHRPMSQREMEAEADCWAARHAGPYELAAAIQWFETGHGGDYSHGSPLERAAILHLCSGI